MKKVYETNDIQYFLYEHGVLWNGVNKCENSFDDMIFADVKFFDKNGYKDAEIYLNIDELTFEIFTEDCQINYQDTRYSKSLIKDYSFEWIESLLEKHPENAPYILTAVEEKMRKIHEKAEKEIEPLQAKINKIKENEQSELDIWRKVKDLAISSESQSSSQKR